MVQTFGAAALLDGSYDSLGRANAGAILGRVDPSLVKCLPEAWVEFLFSMQAYLRVITLQQILHMGASNCGSFMVLQQLHDLPQ